MRGIMIAVGLWAMASGCTTHRAIELDPPSRSALAVVAVEVGAGPAALVLDTASVPAAIDLRLGVDSLRWRTRDGGRHAVDPARIRAIEIGRRGRGLLEGAAGGLGAALLAAGVTALCCEAPPEAWFPPELVVGVGVGIVGIPLGALIGVARGHRVVFRPR